MAKNQIITIDGPVASGKSTVGRMLAIKLGYIYLDTGAIYRVIALEAKKRELSPDDEKALGELCAQVDISFKREGQNQKVFSKGEDVTGQIRENEISMLASSVSALKAVRDGLIELQRGFGKQGNIVVDGRDAGTVVFPEADFKFFLNADVERRTERRCKELIEKNKKIDYNLVFNDLLERDRNDSSRLIAPLKPAEDAVIIDTTEMTIEDVINNILEHLHC